MVWSKRPFREADPLWIDEGQHWWNSNTKRTEEGQCWWNSETKRMLSTAEAAEQQSKHTAIAYGMPSGYGGGAY